MTEHGVSGAAGTRAPEVPAGSRSRATREAILQATESSFLERGFTGTRLVELTGQVGLTTGAFYRHFPSKHAIFEELLASAGAPQVVRSVQEAAVLDTACAKWLACAGRRAGTLRATFELARAGSDAARLAKDVRDRLIPALAHHLPRQDHVAARILTDSLAHWAYNSASGWLPARDASEVASVVSRLVDGGLYTDATTVPPDSERLVAERSQNPRPTFEPFIEWTIADSKDEPRSKRGRRTWEAIREAAIRVLSTRSLSDVTALDVAREAGVSSGTVYRYFVDKEDIFRSLQASAEHDIVRDTHLPLERGRLAIAGMLLSYLEVYRHHIALFRAWQDLLHRRTEMAEAWVGMRNRFIETATRAIRFGQRIGIARPDLPAELVAELHSIVYEAVAYSRVVLGWDIDTTDERVAGVVNELFVGGLRAR